MYRCDTSSAVAVYGGFAPAGTPGHFSTGNPTVGQRGTVPGCDWFEGVQEELMSLLTAGGIVAQKGNVRQLYQAILAMSIFVDNGTGGPNALMCAPLVPFDGLNPNTLIWVYPAATNTGPATLNIGVGGNVAIVRMDGSPLQPGDYVGQQPFPVGYLGGSWCMLMRRMKQQLGGPATLTVNAATGNDATGNLTQPFATLQAAQNWIVSNVDGGGAPITVNCSGNFTAPLSITAPTAGVNTPPYLTYNFLAGSTLATAGDCVVVAGGGSAVTLQGPLSLSSTGANGLRIFDGANVAISGLNFGACPNASHILLSESPRLTLNAGGYSISGSAQTHFYLYDAARIRPGALSGLTNITLTGNPNFAAFFAYANNLSLISIGSNLVAFVGNATGVRYAAALNSVINTVGGGASYFPGSVAGTIQQGAQYA